MPRSEQHDTHHIFEVPFNADDYTAFGGLTWTPDPDYSYVRCQLENPRKMNLWFAIGWTTLAGTVGAPTTQHVLEWRLPDIPGLGRIQGDGVTAIGGLVYANTADAAPNQRNTGRVVLNDAADKLWFFQEDPNRNWTPVTGAKGPPATGIDISFVASLVIRPIPAP